MKTEKDNGLRKALKASSRPTLPSNFTYRTMMKLEEEIRLQEKTRIQRQFIFTLLVFCSLTAGVCLWISSFSTLKLKDMMPTTPNFGSEAVWFGILLLVLFTLDYVMRSIYRKRHPLE